MSVAFKNHVHVKEMSCEVLATNCYSKAGPLENTDVQPGSDPFGAPSKGAYRTWRNEAAGMEMAHMMESVGHSLLASVSCALYMSG